MSFLLHFCYAISGENLTDTEIVADRKGGGSSNPQWESYRPFNLSDHDSINRRYVL